MREKCRDFVRRRHTYRGGAVLCSRAATHDVVSTGPNGERVMHGRKCWPHANKLAASFAHQDGWVIELVYVRVLSP